MTTTDEYKYTIQFGQAPVGCEREEWDWNEDDDGYRSRVYFTLISPHDVDEDVTLTGNDERTLEALLRMARLDPKQVVRVSVQRGKSFRCAAWERAGEAYDDLVQSKLLTVE